MIERKKLEQREYKILSPFACKSADSKGRIYDETKCSLRTEFQRDRDRIIHSKAFRRLMHKTQVFLAPEGDHFRTRLTHTIEVSQIARTIARGLGLNEDLTEAIALGHDLGHTPFGHSGEKVIDEIFPGGFKHNVQSLRVVDVLEEGRKYPGMNLTMEVRDGILNHTGKVKPFTLEGQIVKISDRIAYINHDIDDALRSEVIFNKNLPQGPLEVLGENHRDRINFLVMDIIKQSEDMDQIYMSEKAQEAMDNLREYMFKNVYYNPEVKRASDLQQLEKIIQYLYKYFLKKPEKIFNHRELLKNNEDIQEMIKDHIAGMTDRYAMNLYNELSIANGWE